MKESLMIVEGETEEIVTPHECSFCEQSAVKAVELYCVEKKQEEELQAIGFKKPIYLCAAHEMCFHVVNLNGEPDAPFSKCTW